MGRRRISIPLDDVDYAMAKEEAEAFDMSMARFCAYCVRHYLKFHSGEDHKAIESKTLDQRKLPF